MTQPSRNPAQLRSMFGANLRRLASDYPTVIGLTRQLGINRTQFNRYLAGESFPRPEVLDRICRFFDVDARILLEPVEQIPSRGQALAGEFLADFLGVGAAALEESEFPSGFYRCLRRCKADAQKCRVSLVYVFRNGPNSFAREFEPRKLGDKDAKAREFRGFLSRSGDGVCLFASRFGAGAGYFLSLVPAPDAPAPCWTGQVLHGTGDQPSVRVVLDYLGRDLGPALAVARRAGPADPETLDQPYLDLLNG